MVSTLLFVSGGEIFVILLAVLLLFGADKIPDIARMMGKGVREFRKATDDIKREFSENTSGVMDDIKSIQSDLSDTFNKEISDPMQESVNETASALEEYQDPYNYDYYYNNQEYNSYEGNEYATENQIAESGEHPAEEDTAPQTGDAEETKEPEA
ncbi:MAG: twin-arginine translocase TatA/TatE family subunit [Bacteroidales bacterium]|jgi:TatA/E family protein of Tat protein translocase|nr:twin-arginine translocase TatA/TatE family subunit [Bacteroidales bacterium]